MFIVYLLPARAGEIVISSEYDVDALLFLYPMEYVVGLGKIGESLAQKDERSKVIDDLFASGIM